MFLSGGRRLGPYVKFSLRPVRARGEKCVARDTRLDRTVGITMQSQFAEREAAIMHVLKPGPAESSWGFDAATDGLRFAIPCEAWQPTASITLVVNWDAELEKK